MISCRSLVLVLTLECFLSVSLASQATKQKVDLIITGGTVVTMNGPRTIYGDGADPGIPILKQAMAEYAKLQ